MCCRFAFGNIVLAPPVEMSHFYCVRRSSLGNLLEMHAHSEALVLSDDIVVAQSCIVSMGFLALSFK